MNGGAAGVLPSVRLRVAAPPPGRRAIGKWFGAILATLFRASGRPPWPIVLYALIDPQVLPRRIPTRSAQGTTP